MMFKTTEKWVVTYAIDSLDPSPMVMSFDTWDEAQDWIAREVEQRVQYTVEHSPYYVTEEERDQMTETEACLVSVEKRTVHMLNQPVKSGPGPASCAQEWWG